MASALGFSSHRPVICRRRMSHDTNLSGRDTGLYGVSGSRMGPRRYKGSLG